MIDIDENTSKRITSLRFFLMLLVMIKHNAIVKGLFVRELPFYEPGSITFIKDFFANGLGELAVPVFFFFSGFLLASSDDSYFVTLKKRFRSIFVPYTIWTVLYFMGWLVLKHFHFMYGNPVLDWCEWGIYDYFERFTGYYHGFRFPFVGSFWFLRDLIILIITYPVLRLLTVKFPLILILLTVLYYILGVLPPLLMQSSFFYFEMGMICYILKINFFALADKINWFDIIIPFILAFTIYALSPEYNSDGGIHHNIFFLLFIFSGIIGILKFSNIIINNEHAFNLAKNLAPYTFFAYAFHSPILSGIVKRITYLITSVQEYGGAFRSLTQFILACILDIGLSLGAGILLSKTCPSLFLLLSGGKRRK